MDLDRMDLIAAIGLVLIAAIVAALGVAFGIFVFAPRIGRMLDRAEAEDEEPGDRPD
jgi:Sec-independent protein secretion pathway component TatC